MTPHNKIRSSSDGYEKITAASSQPAQQPNHRPRSSSSDAKLPSVSNGASGPSDASKGLNSPNKDHQPQRPIMIRPRCKSDSSHNQIANQMSRRTLRTISSGIALDESPVKSATSSLPLYPPPPSPSKGNHSPRCPYYNRSPVSPSFPPVHRKSLPNNFHGEKHQHQLQQQQQLFRKSPSKSGDPWQSNYHTHQQQQPPPPSILTVDSHHSEQFSQATHRSQNSHYSIDAGKHGFLSHGHLPHHANDGGMDRCLLRGSAHNHNGGGDGYDSDSAVDSLVDSIVFHYTPGMEVPPAEYALPASILKVYGVDCECFPEEMMPSGEQHHPPARMLGDVTYRDYCESSNSRLVSELTIESDNDDVPENYAMRHDLPDQEKKADFDESGIFCQTRQTNNRLELLPPIGPQSEIPQPRILPYHERKRLFEEEEKRKQKASKKEAKQSGAKIRGDKAEKTESGDNQSVSNAESYQGPFQWLGQLAALITGQQTQKQSGILSQKHQHKHYGSINDESKQYRDRGQAFLQRTEQERIKIKEKCKTDELKNVTIPVYKRHSFGHSRAKMSSLSNALDSIADNSGDDDEEDETSSYDEETGSSYYDDDDDSSQSNTTESSRKVWKYGEPSVTSKKKMASKRDRIMERERLLQEEYEFRLHRLTRENERVAKKFRLCVLVTVAFILVAALSFAMVVCIKMLLLSG